MEEFRTVTYEVHNPKIKKSVRFAVLADLHGSIFGEENSALLKKIQENAPDAILLAGDMVVRMDPSTLETARKLLCTLAKNFPIFYAMGNHETKMKAKAFLKNPPILIFDEATSALDNESEKVVQQSLERLAKDRTTFVIAHRLSTIRNARRILVLTEDGIAEEGTHQELMEKDGVYAKLCKAGL